MKTKFYVTCVCLFISFCIYAQKGYNDKINKKNNKEQKNGYWIEDRGFDTVELYYQNGQKSGVFKSYSKKGTLSAFGEYTNGKKSGIWYYFGDKGHLLMIQKDFKINTDTVFIDNNVKYVYPYKCYAITYYPNGIVQNEGTLLWNEDSELDTTREYGEWKYYDESGKLIRKKVF